jgi:YggT family protein
MFVISNLLVGLADVLNFVLIALYWLIIARAILSWVSPDPYNPIVMFITRVTEPILEPIRERLPMSLKMSIDISPIIAFLVIIFLKSFLIRSIVDLAYRLQ